MNRFVIIWMIVISILTFVAFGLDKQKAVRGKWRIKESTLLLLSLIGGAAGGLIGMAVFRHKIRKAKFIIAVPVMFAAQMALLAVITASFILSFRTNAIRDDYSSVRSNEKYETPLFIDGVEVITQDVSCGYAVIEMFSAWDGGNITEEELYAEYGKVVTSTGRSFCREMNKQFPEYTTEIRKWLKNTELIDCIHETLSRGIPVPFEWAALYGDDWTLHYSLIIGADIPGDRITVANPYGYNEELTLDEFLERTSFDAYENMPLFLKLGFAFGIFEKNTVFAIR